MTSKLGENMQREWDGEPRAVDLWEALQARKKDRDHGISMLTELAGHGSALAMMYIGHTYVKDTNPDRIKLGEEWLRRSAEEGSIEGRFQLACHYQRQRAWEKARVELEVLTEKGYSPATYDLVRLLYNGNLGCSAVPEAVAYLKRAIDDGHLPSMALLSRIYRKEKLGISGKIAAHWLCLTKIPAVVRCMWSYPSSDRLRPFGAYSRA